MAGYKVEQRRLNHRGREFHFVSYEGVLANPARRIEPIVPAWFLMSAGKRWVVMPHVPSQDVAELDRQLIEWLDENIFATAAH